MTHQDFRRRLGADVLAVALLLIFAVAAHHAVVLLAPVLPGGAMLWLGIAGGCFALGLLVAYCLIRNAANVDELLSEIAQPRTSEGWEWLPAIDEMGELADVIEFDFPAERPRLVLIDGGRDAGEGAA